MDTREYALELYRKFNSYALDLYPGADYSLERCIEIAEMIMEIRRLAKERGELLLAHYYQRPEIQEAADFVGDSLGLGLKAKELLESKDAPSCVRLCAVRFMGDTLNVVLGDRMRVFMPNFAGCSLVASIKGIPFEYDKDSERLVSLRLLHEKPKRHPVDAWLEKNPDGLVLSYMNSDPESKAKSYAVFTSRNAARVLEYAMRENPGKRIFMLPDQYLSGLVLQRARISGNPWIKPELVDVFPGLCHVHKQKIGPLALDEAMRDHPGADLLVHPECGCAVDCLIRAETGGFPGRKTHICSTQEMIDVARAPGSAKEFIVATETGHIYTLRKSVPEKTFHPVTSAAVCEFMKATTLEQLLASLRDEDESRYEVTLDRDIREKGWTAIDRMLQIP